MATDIKLAELKTVKYVDGSTTQEPTIVDFGCCTWAKPYTLTIPALQELNGIASVTVERPSTVMTIAATGALASNSSETSAKTATIYHADTLKISATLKPTGYTNLTISSDNPTVTGNIVIGPKSSGGSSGGTGSGSGSGSGTGSGGSYIQISADGIAYTVKFNGNGATSGSMSNQSFTYGVAQDLTPNTFSRSHTVTYDYKGGSGTKTSDSASATFNGWATSASGSKVYNDKQSVSNLTTTAGGTVNLYANWTPGSVTLPEPTRAGYAFAGWATSSSATSGSKGSYTLSSDVTLYAVWTINKYTITCTSNNTSRGTVTPTSVTNVPYGTTWSSNGATLTVGTTTVTATAKDDTAQYNYSVGSWSPASGTVTGATTITHNFPEPAINKYTISFGVSPSGYGTVSPTSVANVPYGSTFSTSGNTITINGTTVTATPTSPAGYTRSFSSWSNTDSVTGQKTITANFTSKTHTYTIKFNANNGTGTMSNMSMTYDSAKNLTANTFSRTGYTFQNWNTSADGKGTSYTDGASVKNLTATDEGIVTLYAIWKTNTYTVKFAGNGATAGSMSNQSFTYGETKALTANAFSRSHTITYNYNGGSGSPATATAAASFNGWSCSNGNSYTDKQSVSNLTSAAGGEVTMTAKWTFGTVTLPAPSRTGYEFMGWSTSSTATSGSTGSYTVSKDEPLYAIWKARTYNITYAKGVSTGGTLPTPNPQPRTYPNAVTLHTNSMTKSNTTANSYKVTYAQASGVTTTLPSPNPAVSVNTTTYSPDGWTTSSTAVNNKTHSNATAYYKDATTEVTLYPNFKTTTTNSGVTLGGKCGIDSKSSTDNGVTITVTYNKGLASSGTLPSNQSATGSKITTTTTYTHTGWKGSDGVTYDLNKQIKPLATDLTMTPIYTSTTGNSTSGAPSIIIKTNSMSKSSTTSTGYLVKYNANGGSVSKSQEYATNTTSYTADGWTTGSSNTNDRDYANGAAATTSLTLYPNFKTTLTYGTVSLPTPTRSHYTFKGWSTSSSASSGTTGTYKPTGNVTLYAIWEAEETCGTCGEPGYHYCVCCGEYHYADDGCSGNISGGGGSGGGPSSYYYYCDCCGYTWIGSDTYEDCPECGTQGSWS